MQIPHNILQPKENIFRRWLKIPVETEDYQPPRMGLIFLQVLVALLFSIFVIRFWYLQVHKGEEFSQKSQENRLREERIIAPRGLIADVHGNILADNRVSYALTIIRENCPDIPTTLAQVCEWTGINQEALTKKYRQDRLRVMPFEPQLLVTNIDIALVSRIEAELFQWPGLEIIAHSKRVYPAGDLYAHILGYVAEASEKNMADDPALSMGDLVGKQGLELVQEETLRGKKGLYQLEVDVLGRSLSRQVMQKPRSGILSRLSLDSRIQMAAWSALEGQVGSIIVMDPDTGHLVALVTAPAYDNNLFTSGISHKDWAILRDNPRFPLQNRVIQSVYPPGSIWKLMMAGLFLQEGINPRESVFCSGETTLGNRVFRCWKKGGHGHMNMADALIQSCDVYFYHFGERVGINKIEAYAKASGFGAPTGIILPHEKSGLVPSRAWKKQRFDEPWVGGETLNVSIGQGFTLVTPLQIATYVSALINGGDLLRPQLLADAPREVQSHLPTNTKYREFIVDAMRKTASIGTARVIKRKDADMGGKTGTAQVVKIKMSNDRRLKNSEMEYKQRDHAWIATWGAKNTQRYVVVVMVEHGGGGSSVAGPIAKKVYDALFGEDTDEPA